MFSRENLMKTLITGMALLLLGAAMLLFSSLTPAQPADAASGGLAWGCQSDATPPAPQEGISQPSGETQASPALGWLQESMRSLGGIRVCLSAYPLAGGYLARTPF